MTPEDARLQARWTAEALAGPVAEVLAPLVADLLRRQPPVPRLSYSVDEAAEALGISRDKVYALIRGGELPSISLGGQGSRRIIRAEALRAFLEGAEAATVGISDHSPSSVSPPGLDLPHPPAGGRAGRGARDRRRA